MAKIEVIQGIKMVSIPAGSYMMGHDWKDDPSLDKNINKYSIRYIDRIVNILKQ